MHNFLMLITALLPCKTIQINNEDYLQRYYAGEEPDGTQYWLHRFLRSDSERHLHSHPWTAASHILTGQYVEQVKQVGPIHYLPGDINRISPQHVHRILEVQCDTWTLMVVQPDRESTWHFIDDNGDTKTMETSPPDWWKTCRTRDNKIAFTQTNFINYLRDLAGSKNSSQEAA